jgi:signal transduction histidine kinase
VHPILARPTRLLLYLAVWFAGGVLLAAALCAIAPRPFGTALGFAAPLAVLYGFVCLSAWWVCRARPLSGDLLFAGLSQFGAAVLTSTVWAIAATAWGLVVARLDGQEADRALLARDVALMFALGIPLYALSAAVSYLLLALEESHAAVQRALESQVSAREAELRALRAQLNPHFLFNSLNSINALVGSDPEGARRMCEGLGDFLRKTLQLGARESVRLDEEMALVDRYLAIEQVRFGARLAIERFVAPDALACELPPLLLQPLVENAVKHGVAGRIEGGTVRISAGIEGDRLRVALENPVDDDAPARAGEGLGLEIVRQRLAALGGAGLTVTRTGGWYRAALNLPATSEVGHD